jgi:surface polysaccharide O-acyltransferase-like enzyme
MLTAFLAVGSFDRSGDQHGNRHFWLSRARRIALPWLFWCAVYRVIFEIVADEPFEALRDPMTFLIGPSIHLWFLPFVILMLPLIPILSLSIRSRRDLWVGAGALFLVAVPMGILHADVGLAGWFRDVGLYHQPLPQWFFSIPLFLYGALAAIAHRLNQPMIAVCSAALVSIVLFLYAPEFASVQMILVAVGFELLWRWRLVGTWPTVLAGAAFGIYLLHPAAMLVAYKAFGADVDRSFAAIFAFALCWALTLILQRLPVLRNFV